ncbi:MAG: hypothetical protein ACYTGK_03980 [Planctomycetota bacterium]|jgi:hypothetical protein
MTHRVQNTLFALMTLVLAAAVTADAGDGPSPEPTYAIVQEIAELDAAIESVKAQIAHYESLIATYGAIPVYWYSGTIQQWQYEVNRLKSILAALEAERDRLEAELKALSESTMESDEGSDYVKRSPGDPDPYSEPDRELSSNNLPDIGDTANSLTDSSMTTRTGMDDGSGLLRDDGIKR